MKITFCKYQGAGNDFLIADNRDGSIQLTPEQVAALCDRRYGVGADGLMLLEEAVDYEKPLDFCMKYYNSDGSTGMMCGNGGRCIVAYASTSTFRICRFLAADGYHEASIKSDTGFEKTVCLQMKDVDTYEHYDSLDGVDVPSEGYFLDTGTRHYVRIVEGLEDYDVVGEGRAIRYGASQLLPVGVNVNFIEPGENGVLKVRTYEKGVEDETYACGTGIVASCIAAYKAGIKPTRVSGRDVLYEVKAKRDNLLVCFRPQEEGNGIATEVYLTGPAVLVAEISVWL